MKIGFEVYFISLFMPKNRFDKKQANFSRLTAHIKVSKCQTESFTFPI